MSILLIASHSTFVLQPRNSRDLGEYKVKILY